ncbi:aminotransferase class IV family protein [Nonomuraea antimicrobica]|uniref:Aminotransferase class IV family protein n=1 Tax=Nonomuraea antimicrobica TaxID=561173 RepID=A0ABP7E7H4_9ACTN
MALLDGTPVSADMLQALGLANYGHFTTLRVDGGRVRGLPLHLERLGRDCLVTFGADLDQERARAYIRQAVEGDDGTIVVRVTVFDPDLEVSRPGAAARPRILVTTRPAPILPLPPLRVRTTRHQRALPRVKNVGLFGVLHSRRAAQLDGFDDALFLDDASFVSEGTTWNAGFFDGEHVVWPRAEVLDGVTMRLLQRAHDATVVRPVHSGDLPGMRAAFATNAAIGVRPISLIDDLVLPGEHPILDTLREKYDEIPPERL